jgi:hypothetical protein
VGAAPEAVVPVTLGTFIVYIYGQERSAKWRRDALRAEFDGMQQTEGKDVQKRLDKRLQENRDREQPSLFGPKDGEQ